MKMKTVILFALSLAVVSGLECESGMDIHIPNYFQTDNLQTVTCSATGEQVCYRSNSTFYIDFIESPASLVWAGCAGKDLAASLSCSNMFDSVNVELLMPTIETQIKGIVQQELYKAAMNLEKLMTNNTGPWAVNLTEIINHAMNGSNCTVQAKYVPILDELPKWHLAKMNGDMAAEQASEAKLLSMLGALDTQDTEIATDLEIFLLTNFNVTLYPNQTVLLTHLPIALHEMMCGTRGKDLQMFKQFIKALSMVNMSDPVSFAGIFKMAFMYHVQTYNVSEHIANYTRDYCVFSDTELMMLEQMEEEEEYHEMEKMIQKYMPAWWLYTERKEHYMANHGWMYEMMKMAEQMMADDSDHSEAGEQVDSMGEEYYEKMKEMKDLKKRHMKCSHIQENKAHIISFYNSINQTNFTDPNSVRQFMFYNLRQSDNCSTDAQINAVLDVIQGHLMNASEIEMEALYAALYKSHITDTGMAFIAEAERVWSTVVGEAQPLSMLEKMLITHMYYKHQCENTTAELDAYLMKWTDVLSQVDFGMINETAIMIEFMKQFPMAENFTQNYEKYHSFVTGLSHVLIFNKAYEGNVTAYIYDIVAYLNDHYDANLDKTNIDSTVLYQNLCNNTMMSHHDRPHEECEFLEQNLEHNYNEIYMNFTKIYQMTNFSDPASVVMLLDQMELLNYAELSDQEQEMAKKVISDFMLGKENPMYDGATAWFHYKIAKMMDKRHEMMEWMDMCSDDMSMENSSMPMKMMCNMKDMNMTAMMENKQAEWMVIGEILKSYENANFSDLDQVLNLTLANVDKIQTVMMFSNETKDSLKEIMKGYHYNLTTEEINMLWAAFFNTTISPSGLHFAWKVDQTLAMYNLTNYYIHYFVLAHKYHKANENETVELDMFYEKMIPILDKAGSNLTDIFDEISNQFPLSNMTFLDALPEMVKGYLPMILDYDANKTCGVNTTNLYVLAMAEEMDPRLVPVGEIVFCALIQHTNKTENVAINQWNTVFTTFLDTNFTNADNVTALMEAVHVALGKETNITVTRALAEIVSAIARGETMSSVNGYLIEFYKIGMTAQEIAFMDEIKRILVEANVTDINSQLVQSYQNFFIGNMWQGDMVNYTMIESMYLEKFTEILKTVDPNNVDFAKIKAETQTQFPDVDPVLLDVAYDYMPMLIEGLVTNDTAMIVDALHMIFNSVLPNNTYADEFYTTTLEMLSYVYGVELNVYAAMAMKYAIRVPFMVNNANVTAGVEEFYKLEIANMKLQIEVAKVIKDRYNSDLTKALDDYIIARYGEVPAWAAPMIVMATPLSHLDYNTTADFEILHDEIIKMFDAYIELYPDNKLIQAHKLQFEVQWAIQFEMKFTEVEAMKLYEIMKLTKEAYNITSEMQMKFIQEYFPQFSKMFGIFHNLPEATKKELYVTTVMAIANVTANKTTVEEAMTMLVDMAVSALNLKEELGNLMDPLTCKYSTCTTDNCNTKQFLNSTEPEILRTTTEAPETTKAGDTTTTKTGETTKPSDQTTKPSGQTTQLSGQTTKPSGQTTQPSGQTTQLSGQTTTTSGTAEISSSPVVLAFMSCALLVQRNM